MQEKEKALNLTIDVFCRLMMQHANVAQLITMYEDSFPIFSLFYVCFSTGNLAYRNFWFQSGMFQDGHFFSTCIKISPVFAICVDIAFWKIFHS